MSRPASGSEGSARSGGGWYIRQQERRGVGELQPLEIHKAMSSSSPSNYNKKSKAKVERHWDFVDGMAIERRELRRRDLRDTPARLIMPQSKISGAAMASRLRRAQTAGAAGASLMSPLSSSRSWASNSGMFAGAAASPGTAPLPSSSSYRNNGSSNNRPADLLSSAAASLASYIPPARDEVLRFSGYITERVDESAVERERVRRIDLFYYTADGTVSMEEKKQGNSGIPQGSFLRRHRVPMKGGRTLELADLRRGSTLRIYGRDYRVVDCPPSTAAFLENRGLDPGQATASFPEDRYATLRRRLDSQAAAAGGPLSSTRFAKKVTPMKEFMEAACGRSPARHSQMFLDNDRKVLRFYCMWDDTKTYCGDKQHYIIHFFLADGTCEILHRNHKKNGVDPFPKLLARTKLPKSRDEDFFESASPTGANVEEGDLYIGAIINVFGRSLIIHDCDNFTRDHLVRTYGFTADETKPIQQREKPMEMPRLATPPKAVFGSDEDGLLSCKSTLIPRVPPKVVSCKDAETLRFTAKISNERHRNLVVQFFTLDNTVMVFEPPIKNSGVMGGRFAKRQKHFVPNWHPPRPYGVEDLFLGARIIINGHDLEIVGADEHTTVHLDRRYQSMAEYSNAEDLKRAEEQSRAICNKIRTTANLERLREQLAELDPKETGNVHLSQFVAALKEHTPTVTERQTILALRPYRKKQKGHAQGLLIEYQPFLERLQDLYGSQKRSVVGSSGEGGSSPEQQQQQQQRRQQRKHREPRSVRIQRALKRFARLVITDRSGLIRVFNRFDVERLGKMKPWEFMRALVVANGDMAGTQLAAEDVQVLFQHICPPGSESLELNGFLSMLEQIAQTLR